MDANSKKKLDKLRQKLEGHVTVRVAAGISAAAVLGCTIYSCLDIAAELKKFVELYMKALSMAGCIAILCVEFKDSAKTEMTEWFHKWFPFLTVSWGKGMFMIMTSLIGLSFIEDDFKFIVIPNICMSAVGCIYVVMWWAQYKKNKARFSEKTMIQTTMACSAMPESKPLLHATMTLHPPTANKKKRSTMVVGHGSNESAAY